MSVRDSDAVPDSGLIGDDIPEDIVFEDLFDLDEIQDLQDRFARATGVASIITHPDGTPITQPSRFCRLCQDVIRKTAKGLTNCYRSDSVIGRHNPDGPIVQTCLSGGLWDAGASITLGGRHLANWLIGQVRNEAQNETQMLSYAREIGADPRELLEAFREVPTMSKEQFEGVANTLFVMANQLSRTAYQNVQKARFIAEREEAEDALRYSEQRYALAQLAAGIGSWDWNMLTGDLLWSEQIEPMFGFAPGAFESSYGAFLRCVHPDDRQHVIESVRATVEDDEPYEIEHRIIWPDGTVRWVSESGEVFRDASGKAVRMLGVVQDISDRKRTQSELVAYRDHLEELVEQRTEELAAAKEAAEAANRAKSVFLANMSHELRTPLNSVLGFSSMLAREDAGPLNAEQKSQLDLVHKSGEHLLTLINDILSLAKIEAGRTAVEIGLVDLDSVLAELNSTMNARAAERGLSLSVERAPTVPRWVQTDETKLRQVLMNLVGNAIKFTTEGYVRVRVSLDEAPSTLSSDRESAAASIVRLLFEVEDTGIGIAADDRQRVFDAFTQVGNVSPESVRGTGLGLAICQQYVELMGGTVEVDSSLGRGSVFRFRIPMKVVEAPEENARQSRGRVKGLVSGARAPRILVAEDQEENRLLLGTLLRTVGFEVREAIDGQQAVHLFAEWSPDFVWMDIRMPGLDGLEATRQIKATDAGRSTPVVALTAHAFEEERERILAAGCDGFVRKPYRDTELFETMARHLGVQYVYESPAHGVEYEAGLDVDGWRDRTTVLPESLQGQLRAAVVALDGDAIEKALAEVAQHDTGLCAVLRSLVEDFAYHELRSLLGAPLEGDGDRQ